MTNIDDERERRIAHPSIRSRLAFALADLVSKPEGPPPGGFLNILPEAFGAVDACGDVFVIGYKGEWYTPLKPKFRVRLHNWLITIGEWFRQ